MITQGFSNRSYLVVIVLTPISLDIYKDFLFNCWHGFLTIFQYTNANVHFKNLFSYNLSGYVAK